MKQVINCRYGIAQLVLNDDWILINSAEELALAPQENLILPLSLWQAQQTDEVLAGLAISPQGIWLSPTDNEDLLQPWLKVLPLIALYFPSFRDGRPYTQAYRLRIRLGWSGQLRAFGDVLRDQLSHMRQCGIDSFAIREDKSAEDALKGLAGISVLYGRSALEPKPLFRRR